MRQILIVFLFFISNGHANKVLYISIDGLRGDVVRTWGEKKLPNFYRFRNFGVFTDEARTDPEATYTLANHTSMLTGRHQGGKNGHQWRINNYPAVRLNPLLTLHHNHYGYMFSVFDVVQQQGYKSTLYANKKKFIIYQRSWANKIDKFKAKNKLASIQRGWYKKYLKRISSKPGAYNFLHLSNPDRAGHRYGWSLQKESQYMQSVLKVDELLGALFARVDLKQWVIILSSDHGGQLGTSSHSRHKNPQNFTIPFYVLGKGVAKGVDLYVINQNVRKQPKALENPGRASILAPIRNGDSANLALSLLDLPAIPGSTINARQNLRVK